MSVQDLGVIHPPPPPSPFSHLSGSLEAGPYNQAAVVPSLHSPSCRTPAEGGHSPIWDKLCSNSPPPFTTIVRTLKAECECTLKRSPPLDLMPLAASLPICKQLRQQPVLPCPAGDYSAGRRQHRGPSAWQARAWKPSPRLHRWWA